MLGHFSILKYDMSDVDECENVSLDIAIMRFFN